MGGGGGGGGGDAGGQAAAEAEVKVEVEKTHFDMELATYDAKSKIKVIKEIRSLLGLGLKEAKEMVESAPTWILKDVKKEDAEEMKEKLVAIGAEINLA
jgi:large subunit ribosomal protein L7/L12